jgi:MerR family transcriptional regulator, light-induced transcriptional regulator
METRDASSPQFPIRWVVRRTGLNPSVLRAWERRYGVVEPGRSEGGQRLYSEEDIRRLTLVKEAVEAGHSIGQVARLSSPELRRLLQGDTGRSGRDASAGTAGEEGGAPRWGDPGRVLHECLKRVRDMEPRQLEEELNRAAVGLNPEALVDQVLVPLLNRIGLLWEAGEMGPAAEHLATGVLRRFLDFLIRTLADGRSGRLMLVGTPAGHRHEYGALLAAVVVAGEGWEVVVMGADLPAHELAQAATRKGASAVALSALYPTDDPALASELEDLRSRLAPDVEIVVGGAAAGAQAEHLAGLGIRYLPDLKALRDYARGRSPAARAADASIPVSRGT